MIELHLDAVPQTPRILLLGAHCDDIEIGCGATVLKLAKRYPNARILWVTLSSDPQREAETRSAAAELTRGIADVVVRIERFRGSYFPYTGAEIKDFLETLKEFQPDLIFTHGKDDFHQDHRVTNELTWNTFRNHFILEYEIPKYDGDLGRPNTFVALTRADVQRKCDILLKSFPSQAQRSWFTHETFEALARLRGIECNAPEGYAEAYFARKTRLSL